MRFAASVTYRNKDGIEKVVGMDIIAKDRHTAEKSIKEWWTTNEFYQKGDTILKIYLREVISNE